jgi:hypothetical protein
MRQIHVLLTLTDEDAAALTFAGTSADQFVQAIRKRWAFEKRNAQEMYAAHLSMRPVAGKGW